MSPERAQQVAEIEDIVRNQEKYRSRWQHRQPSGSARETASGQMNMQKLAEAERLLSSLAGLIDGEAQWTDAAKARPLYDRLRGMDPSVVTKALVRKVMAAENRLRVLFVAVKLGIPGSEDRLNDVLEAYGDKSMAEDYLNSGSQALYEGGRLWARRNGYMIGTGWGSHRVSWGRF